MMEKRDGKECFRKLDMADYAKKSFGMFGGGNAYGIGSPDSSGGGKRYFRL